MKFKLMGIVMILCCCIFFTGCKNPGEIEYDDTPLPVTIDTISPLNSSNVGSVSISGITGTNFSNELNVTITKQGKLDITATNIIIQNSSEFSCEFDLTGAAEGAWTVSVSNSLDTDELIDAFTVTNALYVSTGGDDTNIGTASSSKLTLQNAIDTAAPGQHIRVAEGTYNTESNIELKEGVSIYGGYDSVTWEHDTELNTTTIQDTRTVVTDTSTATEPYTVLYAGSDISNSTIIDGFTLQGLTAGAAFTSAIFCNRLSPSLGNTGPTIRNNIITGGGGSTYSFGILLKGYLRTVIDQNVINGGDGKSSYALYGLLNSEVKIKNNTIHGGSGNYTYGLYFRQSSDPYIHNNYIYGGSGRYHTHGIYLMNLSGSAAVVRNNTIDGGFGTDNYTYGIVLRNSDPTIENNIIFCKGNTYEYGIFEYVSEPAAVNNNDIYNCDTALYRQYNGGTPLDITEIATVNALGYADSNISIDPSFSNPGNYDFHLTASTPASVTEGGLNGIDESWLHFPDNDQGSPIDKDQEERPNSPNNWAIGAYEY